MARKKDPLSNARSIGYELLKVMGDVQAIRKGRIGERVANRITGRMNKRHILGRFMR